MLSPPLKCKLHQPRQGQRYMCNSEVTSKRACAHTSSIHLLSLILDASVCYTVAVLEILTENWCVYNLIELLLQPFNI